MPRYASGSFERALIRSSKVTVRGQEAIIANLHRVSARTKRDLRITTDRYRREVVRTAKNICPVRTGRMRGSITGELSPQGYAFEVFYDPAPFIRDGQPYYPVYVELGTSRMPARPVLRWAYDAHELRYKAEIASVIRRNT